MPIMLVPAMRLRAKPVDPVGVSPASLLSLLSPALYNQNEQIGRIRLIHGLLSSEFFSAFTTGALPGCNLKTGANLSRPIGANRRWCGSGFPFGSFRPLSPCPGQRNRRHHLPLWPWRVEQVHRLLRLRRVRRRRQRCRDQQARSHRCQRVPAHQ